MVQTLPTVDAGSATSPKSLPARVAGIIFSPRATYADIAARPRWVAAFLLVYLVTASVATAFMSTEVGRAAVVDQQITQAESYGRHFEPSQIDRLEALSGYYIYLAPVLQLVSLVVGSVVVAGIAFAVFN